MKKEYRARCHCGRIRFSFRSEEITIGKRCNCSICIRKGAVMSSAYIPAEDFQPHKNPDDLSTYLWNDRVVKHVFCKTCGVFPYNDCSECGDEYGYRVNLACVEGIDPLSLAIEIIDGRSMGISPEPGPHPGEENASSDLTLTIARQFASRLDSDDFSGAATLMTENCPYETGRDTLVGPAAIVKSYREASEWGRKNLDGLEYESSIESYDEKRATILFIDHLRKGGRSHVYRCKQVISVSDAGKINAIQQLDIEGERALLNNFFEACGLKRG